MRTERNSADRDRARRSPILVVIPRDDSAFADAAAQSVASEGRTPELLQHALRIRFPRTVVRARDLSAEVLRVWYVYREGHWIASGPLSGLRPRLRPAAV